MSSRVSSGLAKRTVAAGLALGKRLESAYEGMRFDGWVNVATGLGGSADKRMYGAVRKGPIITDRQGMDMFHHEWLARLICEILPEKAMRGGYELVVEDDEGELTSDVHDRVDELQAWSKFTTAAIFARAAGGGGACLIGVQDGARVDQPVNLEAVERINYVVPLDRRSLMIERWYEDPNHPQFGEPELYRLHRQTSARSSMQVGGEQSYGALIHESRLIVFPGARTGDEEKVANSGWDYSILQAPYDVLRDFGIGWAGAATLLQEASQGVFKVKDLTTILASEGGEDRLRVRFRAIEMAKSIARSLLVDAEHEDYTRVPVAFTGVPDTLQAFCSLLAAATRIPVTILMGQAPAGLNATGESDLLTWQGTVEDWQTQVLAPRWEKFVRLLLVEGRKAEPESWKLRFAFAQPETPKQSAERRKLVAETDKLYIDAGVVLSEEVGLSRFGAEGWSAEMQIDLDLRRDLSDVKEENMRKAADADAPPVEDLGTAGARAEALDKISAAVARGEIDEATGTSRIVVLFGMSEEQAKSVLGSPKKTEAPVVAAPAFGKPALVPGKPKPPTEDEPKDPDA